MKDLYKSQLLQYGLHSVQQRQSVNVDVTTVTQSHAVLTRVLERVEDVGSLLFGDTAPVNRDRCKEVLTCCVKRFAQSNLKCRLSTPT
jgi:hypothetical protein